jgi:RHS repeat-associated protein
MGTVRYTTANGEVIAEKRGGVRRQYIPDPLGSTVALLDNSQARTDTFQYWPYGEESGRTGTTATPLRFVGTWGYYRDSAAREYVRARHLDIRAGRWATVDPLRRVARSARALNRYRYCSAAPTVNSDPSGMAEWRQLPPPNRFFGWLYYYEHAYLVIDGGCDVYDPAAGAAGGIRRERTFGFWPVLLPWGPQDGNIEIGDPEEGNGKIVLSNGDPAFGKRLCDCIRKSLKNPPSYNFGAYVCGSWVADMWNCAKHGRGNDPDPVMTFPLILRPNYPFI